MEKEILYRVVSKHFVAGAVVKDGKIIKAPPILKYCEGKTADWLEQYAHLKKWVIEKVPMLSSDPDHG